MNLTESHRQELMKAMLLLEHPGIAAKVTNLLGSSIEKGIEMLPENWNEKIGEISKSALLKATNAAIFTMKDIPNEKSSNWLHKAGVAITGGVGGFFGFAALAVELPISTTIMLRSIADIAREEGESINDLQTKLACLEVFALGGKSKSDNATESGYYMTRSILAKSVSEAAEFIAKKTLAEEGAPVLLQLIKKIAERFSIALTEKGAAQAIPAVGAAGGALINTIFIDHFQDMAKGHFIVRRLEKIYGKDIVKTAYEEMLKLEIRK